MKCRNARKLVYEFIDGLKDDTKRLDLEKHLSGCPACDKLASQLTRSLDLLHRAPKEKTGEDFAWNLRMRINQERNVTHERSHSTGAVFRSWNLRYATTAVAAFAVVLTVGFVSMKSGFAPPKRSPQAEPAAVAGAATTPPPATRDDSPPEPVDRGNRFFTTVDEGPSGVSIFPDQSIIDVPSAMRPAQIDSLLGYEIQSLTPEERIRYMNILSQYFRMRYLHELGKTRTR
jgi:hypothetical protein